MEDLHKYCQEEFVNVDVLRYMIKKNPLIIDQVDDNGMCALEYYINSHDSVDNIILYELCSPILVGKTNSCGDCFLSQYLQSCPLPDKDAVKLLKDFGNYNKKNSIGYNSLHIYLQTCTKISYDVLKLLVDSTTVKVLDPDGNTPLMLYLKGHGPYTYTVFRMLCTYVDILTMSNKFGDNALTVYIKNSNMRTRLLRYIICPKLLATITKCNDTPLSLFIKYKKDNQHFFDIIGKFITAETKSVRDGDGYFPIHLLLKYVQTTDFFILKNIFDQIVLREHLDDNKNKTCETPIGIYLRRCLEEKIEPGTITTSRLINPETVYIPTGGVLPYELAKIWGNSVTKILKPDIIKHFMDEFQKVEPYLY